MSVPAVEKVCITKMFEVALVWLISAGLAGLLFAVLGTFKAPQAILFGAGISVAYAYLTRNRSYAGKYASAVSCWHILALVLIAVFFRWPPVNYVSGGQDQGVYVNVAAHIVHSGGISVEDEVLKKLAGSDAAGVYAKDNSPVAGDFLLGIFHRDAPSGSELQFQFFHLFPVYMALAGGTLGLDASVVALTLLSVLSILFFYLLALSLSDRPKVAFAAALLLAINPLHGFFSRFPVSEVAALCFTLAAAWLLVRAWRHSKETDSVEGWWDVLLSAGALSCAFLIRMNGFMFLPIFLLIGVAACLYEKEIQARRLVVAWVILANIIYALSLFYGYAYSPIYTSFHLSYAFKNYLGHHWGFWAVLLWALSLIGMLLLYLANREDKKVIVARRLMDLGRRLAGPVTVVALCLWLYKLYLLGWTDRFVRDPVLADRWHIAQTGIGVLGNSSIAVAAQYTAPFVLLLFIALVWYRRLPGTLAILSAFVLMFFCYLAAVQWVIPYQPYYARYLVSEFVPYLLLFVVLAIPHIASPTLRRIALGSVAVGGMYSALLCVGQLRANEQYGMDASYERIASWVGNEDLLLLETETLTLPYQLIEMPFLLRYDKYVARISKNSLKDASYLRELQERFDQLYLLSGNMYPSRGFEPVDATRFQEWVAEQGRRPPIRSGIRNQGMAYLHVLRSAILLPNEWLKIGGLSSRTREAFFEEGWSLVEPWGMWSDGRHAKIEIPTAFDNGTHPVRLELEVRPFTSLKHPKQHVRARVDGKVVFEADITDVGIIGIPLVKADKPDSEVRTVELDLPDAITPSGAGHRSADSRHLALGLLSMRVEAAASSRDRVTTP